ncbi:ABC transporter permease [Nocardia sp. NBC_01327]|uniref:ABC transporter permease n=1 Tax=Nocardia sp. NBC_01327 TaxID=2903593 RepID=UPI003FA37C74
MSELLAVQPNEWAEPTRAPQGWARVPALTSRVGTFALVEIQKLRHDQTEILTRAVQPVLWMVIFGSTFSRLRSIPTGKVPYLDFLAPGIIAQSALFISIFYGIQIIWDRDAGILNKLLVTPTPRSALIAGKCFAAGVRAIAQIIVVVIVSLLMGVGMTMNPLKIAATIPAVFLGTAFFACLSMTIAGIVQARDRLMGIGQAITMPLFFASNALYPIALMPGWLQVISRINPLSYEVDALRGLLVGTPANLWLDFLVLTGAAVLGVISASSLLGRLVR